jgi:hypothetical protein
MAREENSKMVVGRSKRRFKSRGAAMVEAVVVMPVLITCWGVMMFAGGARFNKIRVQQEAREGTFSYASKACKGAMTVAGSTGTGMAPINSQSGASASGQADVANGAVDTQASAIQEFGTVSGNTTGNFAWAKGYIYGNATLGGHSFYFCNEKDYTGIFAFFNYAVGLVGQILPNGFP